MIIGILFLAIAAILALGGFEIQELSVRLATVLAIISIGAMGISSPLFAPAWRIPQVVTTNHPHTFILRYPFFTPRHLFTMLCITSTFTSGIFLSWRYQQVVPAVCIGGLIAVFGFGVLPHAIRCAYFGRLVLSPDHIRVKTHRCDWEFPWTATTSFAADVTSRDGGAIDVRCPAKAMTSRPTSHKPLDWWTPLKSDDGPWKIVPAMWGVNPNSLLSTLNHLHTHPKHRTTLSAGELTAMLMPSTQSDGSMR
ncbi:hypothetical protein JK358_00940 [Nocardia sp. 2]|uniref:Uncharacterized protein n=1 Tax=Nocardia acididurans TaxID=2802282 RepID=A0ABS1LYG5_9NOCA|nr:hypothetical protein [Nocardia acididurans]MBL1072955.1 hypothetical protein [Nocardia acididurans]